MSLTEIIVDGTLRPDGTIQLDEMLDLTPGRVRIMVQSASPAPPGQRGLADVIDEISRDQQARGFKGRSAEEIDAERREGEEEYEQRMQALYGTSEKSP